MSCRIAAVDLGTNTARLLIADLFENGSFEQRVLQRSIVRLGGGFCRERGLADDAMQRAANCLKQFSETIQQHQVDQVRAVATSAVRDAVNGTAFIARVLNETGIRLQVIDGVTEGSIGLAGLLAGLDRQPYQLLMFDVGGGSTEYTFARGASPFFVQSLPLGVVRLTEGKPGPAEMVIKINRELARLQQQLDEAGVVINADTLLVGTAGTATTLAAISLGMSEYDYRRINNHTLSAAEIRRIYELLLPLSPQERLQVPGLEQGREDLIIAGCLITLLTLECFGMNRMLVSDYGLLEGLVVTDPAVAKK